MFRSEFRHILNTFILNFIQYNLVYSYSVNSKHNFAVVGKKLNCFVNLHHAHQSGTGCNVWDAFPLGRHKGTFNPRPTDLCPFSTYNLPQ